MSDVDEICWARPVAKELIARLYRSEVAGLLDEKCLEEVGLGLYLRCQGILTVGEAQRGRVRCPRCQRIGQESVILRPPGQANPRLTCPRCRWEVSWREYRKTYQRKQLNEGGAGPAFRRFIEQFEQARSPGEKMLAIDRVIHEFHYSFRATPDLPTRPTCVNLIAGKLTDVVAFLDRLSAGPLEAGEARQEWRRKLQVCVVAPRDEE